MTEYVSHERRLQVPVKVNSSLESIVGVVAKTIGSNVSLQSGQISWESHSYFIPKRKKHTVQPSLIEKENLLDRYNLGDEKIIHHLTRCVLSNGKGQRPPELTIEMADAPFQQIDDIANTVLSNLPVKQLDKRPQASFHITPREREGEIPEIYDALPRENIVVEEKVDGEIESVVYGVGGVGLIIKKDGWAKTLETHKLETISEVASGVATQLTNATKTTEGIKKTAVENTPSRDEKSPSPTSNK